MSFYQDYSFTQTGIQLTNVGQFGSAAIGTQFTKLTGEIFEKTATGLYKKIITTNTFFYNVRNYGAIGDGVADDTSAIQAAIDAAAAAGGGTVYAPAGIYMISDSLIVLLTQHNVKILGDGDKRTIFRKKNATDYEMLKVGDTTGFTNDQGFIVASDVDSADNTITLQSGMIGSLGAVKGDWIAIYDESLNSSHNTRMAEFFRIWDITGDVITTHSPIRQDYTVLGTARKAPDQDEVDDGSGGINYLNNELLTLVGGTFTEAAQYRVASNNAGVITSLTLATPGSYTVKPTNPVSVTGGGGSGCTIAAEWDGFAQLAVPTFVHGFELNGVSIDGNGHIAGPGSVNLNNLIECYWAFEPKFVNVKVQEGINYGLGLGGCVGARVENFTIKNLLSSLWKGNVGSFGYGIVELGLNQGAVITNVNADVVRHAYTTASSGLTIGTPYGSIIANGYCSNSDGSAWDTHPGGDDISFINCVVAGSNSSGFQLRGQRGRILGGFASDCIGAAASIVNNQTGPYSGSQASGTRITGFSYRNTNLGIDDNGTDWRNRTPIYDWSNTNLTMDTDNFEDPLINGGFEVWQRGDTFEQNPGDSADRYTADRWEMSASTGATETVERIAHTVDSDYMGESTYFLRWKQTVGGSDTAFLKHRIDNVRTLAGKTVTVSFDALDNKPGGSTFTILFRQHFGSGGTPSADVTSVGNVILSDDLVRHEVVLTIPTLEGKSIGSNEDSWLSLEFGFSNTNSLFELDIDNVQIDLGDTSARWRPVSYDTVLKRCQYYYRLVEKASGIIPLADEVSFSFDFPQMRIAPTAKILDETIKGRLATNTNANVNTLVGGLSSILSFGITNQSAWFRINRWEPLTVGDPILIINDEPFMSLDAEI